MMQRYRNIWTTLTDKRMLTENFYFFFFWTMMRYKLCIIASFCRRVTATFCFAIQFTLAVKNAVNKAKITFGSAVSAEIFILGKIERIVISRHHKVWLKVWVGLSELIHSLEAQKTAEDP